MKQNMSKKFFTIIIKILKVGGYVFIDDISPLTIP